MDHTGTMVNVNDSSLKPADIAATRRLLKHEGYAYLANVADGFDYLTELSRFGTPIPHQGIELVKDVRYDPQIDVDAYSALNMQRLPPHTEWYESPTFPPRYVALWGVQASRGEGGETTIADGYRFLGRFSQREQELLRDRRYEWHGVSNVSGGPPVASVRHSIIERHPDGLIMRYSSRLLQWVTGDDLVSRYVSDGLSFFEAEHASITITRNSVLLWDNWRMMHARNAFNDPGRHLRRLLLAV